MGGYFSREVLNETVLQTSDSCLKCKKKIQDVSHFNLSKCNHVICTECLCSYLEKFTSAKIACPVTGCNCTIPDNIVRKCLTDNQIELYDRYCMPSIAVKCMIAGCDGAIATENGEGHFNCGVCGQPNCLTCKNLHRENEPCGVSVNKETYVKDGEANLREKTKVNLISLTKDNSLMKNPDKSNCSNCYDFLLPREGIIMMPCMHNFCRRCLTEHLKTKETLAGLTCLSCDNPLQHRECRELIGEEKLDILCINAIKFKFYHCKTPDCTSFWDAGEFKGMYMCKKCKKNNCISCATVHEGMTCDEYKNTNQYRIRLVDEKGESERNPIVCFNCNNKFIRSGGCGAMKCNNCHKQVCAFSGKQLGRSGCMCRRSKKCHPNCNIGCIPEGKSKEEVALKRYYYDN